MGHVADRWHVVKDGSRRRTGRFGSGSRWQAVWIDPGTRRERTKAFTTKVDAERFLAGVEVDKLRGAYVDPHRSLLTYGEWAARWRGTLTLKPKTLAGYDSLLRTRVLPRWTDVPLGRIDHEDVAAWVANLNTEVSPSRARQAYHVLTGSLDSAVRARRLASNPARGVDLPSLRPSRRRYLTHEQVLAIIDAAGDRALPIHLLAYVGLRWGEVAGLRVRALDMLRCRVEVVETVAEVNGRLMIDSPKDHERRSVTMPASLRDALASHVVGKRADDYVFTSRDGSALRSGGFRRSVFDRAVVGVGLDGLTPHELRHTCASLLVSQGANVLAVARQLGHADPSVTLRVYADLFDTDLDALGVRLDEAIQSARLDLSRTSDGPGTLVQAHHRERIGA